MFKVGDIVECVAEFGNSYEYGDDPDCEPNTAYVVTGVNMDAKGIHLNNRPGHWWWRVELDDGSPRFKLLDEIYGD